MPDEEVLSQPAQIGVIHIEVRNPNYLMLEIQDFMLRVRFSTGKTLLISRYLLL
jgi:hypothetical protein